MPLRSLLHILLVGLCLAACGAIPRPVEGVPPGLPWQALPLRKWLAEGEGEGGGQLMVIGYWGRGSGAGFQISDFRFEI